jgi:hypothetical protein
MEFVSSVHHRRRARYETALGVTDFAPLGSHAWSDGAWCAHAIGAGRTSDETVEVFDNTKRLDCGALLVS